MSEFRPSRRQVLEGAGLAAAGLSMAGCSGEDPYEVRKPPVPGSDSWLLGEERRVATACGQCAAGCGIRVRVVEGRAVKVEGNQDCPINRGGVGPRGLSSTQVLYDPDRIAQPLRRVGARGTGSLEPIGWDEALELLAERLGGLREGEEGHRLGIVCGKQRGLMLKLWRRFAEAYGTPNFYDGWSTADGTQRRALELMQGVAEVPAHDWAGAHLVLSLGSGILDSSCQLVHFARSRAQGARDASVRARIVHVGPARTRTAMNADEWLQARPGSYAAFALGIAHVLVREGWHDADFVEQHCLGFARWTDPEGREHKGLEELLADYPPARAAELCGVSAGSVERIAREMARTRPCFVVTGQEELRAANGVATAMAVHALNALLGAIDRPGGLRVQRDAPLEEWDEVEPDELAEAALERAPLGADPDALADPHAPSLERLAAALAEGEEGALDTLLLYYANPLYARARPERWRAALAKVPFVVSFSPFLDETVAEAADLVLPDDTFLERWEDDAGAPSLGRAVFGLRQPVVERLLDTRATGDVVIDLAKAIGEPLDEAFGWSDFKSTLKGSYVGIYKAKTGSIVEAKGSTFISRLYEEGYWAGDPYEHEQWDEVLRTESGRLELFSTAVWRALSARAAARGTTVEELARELAGVDDPDLLCLPRHVDLPASPDPAKHPLRLQPYRPSTYAEGSGANLPWLVEQAPWRGRRTWTTEAELHPDTAGEQGVKEGDRVRVASPAGSVEAVTRLSRGVRPGLVRMAMGAGHTAFGRYAKGWGANVMHLVDPRARDPLGGAEPLQGTWVSIGRVSS